MTKNGWQVTRRRFLQGGAGVFLIGALGRFRDLLGTAHAAVTGRKAPEQISTTMIVNGQSRALRLDSRTTLLDALRDHAGLTGVKKGCDHGQCGSCTVLLDDTRILSCLTLAATVQGRKVTTIEGLAKSDGTLHPMQAAFIEKDAFQCGYCTPGQILSAVACVQEGHADNDDDIREYMSGNLCRCAAYPKIVEAIKEARGAIGSKAGRA